MAEDLVRAVAEAVGPTGPVWRLVEGHVGGGRAFVRVDAVHPDREVAVSLHGELDTGASVRIARNLFQILALPITSLRLNLAEVSFIDRTGLEVLNIIRTQALHRQIQFTLREIPDPVDQVLAISGLFAIFTIEPRSERDNGR